MEKSMNTGIATICVGGALLGTFGSAQSAEQLGGSFRSGTFTYSVAECSRDAMAALSQAGFTANLSVLDGQKPAMGVAGNINDNGQISTAMMICGQNKDFTAVVFSTEGSNRAGGYVMSIVEKFGRIGNRK
jgi:hypothetical protein